MLRNLANLALVLVLTPALHAADHLDAPGLTPPGGDGRLDITDIYVFQSPASADRAVLILAVNPAAGLISPTTFHPDADYTFHIDRDGDAKSDLDYRVDFGPVAGGAQDVRLRCTPAKECPRGAVLAQGRTEEIVDVSSVGSLQAGVFDDAFFFDLHAFLGMNGRAFCDGGQVVDSPGAQPSQEPSRNGGCLVNAHPDQAMHERLAAFALGAMDAAEHAEFEREMRAHLAAGCPACEEALGQYEATVIDLARSAPRARSSSALRTRVMDAVRRDVRPGAEPEKSRGVRYLLPWAALLIVGLLGTAGWQRYFSARDELSARERQLAEARTQLAALVDQLDDSRRLGTLLVSAPDVEIVPLAATDPAQAIPTTRVAYSPASARAVAVFEHATAPAGRDYQLWALGPAGVRSLGLVSPDFEGRALLEIELTEPAATLQGFAISLEPLGGSPDPHSPSGPVIAVGTRS